MRSKARTPNGRTGPKKHRMLQARRDQQSDRYWKRWMRCVYLKMRGLLPSHWSLFQISATRKIRMLPKFPGEIPMGNQGPEVENVG
jgi:hypothetical protein